MVATSRRPDSFYALGVRPALAAALAERGIVEPFPIQAASLPDSLAGRDVLGRGRTGSGKTVAFALPLLERVLAAGPRRPGRPRALVLVPTRELAVQVHETIDFLARAVKLKAMTVFGGVRYTGQMRKLERGVDVVIATPGRLEDLIEQGALRLDDVEVVVLDEADLMADMGFLPPVTRILEATPPGQRMLFSATLDAEVARLIKRFLSDPLIHEVDEDDGAPDAEHYLFLVRHDNKPAIVQELLSGGGRTLAFTRTKFAAERLARTLTEAGIPAVDLHGNLRQAARQRNLSSFADGSVSVLVATDIAARGIHVDDVGLVVHIDPPNDPKAFLHRSGRTARAGSEGTVVTLATKNQNKAVRQLMAQVKIKPTQHVVTPGAAILTEVRAPRIEPKASGSSIFEPDPEDVIEDDEPTSSPDRRTPDRGHRPDRRAERPSERERARGPRREAPSRHGDQRQHGRQDADGIDYRPRREPKEHTTGPRGPRPERADTRPKPARRQGEREWTADWWGPEPWETPDADAPGRGSFGAGRRDGGARDSRPAWGRQASADSRRGGARTARTNRSGGPAGQGGASSGRSQSWSEDARRQRPAESGDRERFGREDRRPRPGRDARDVRAGRREEPSAPAASGKNRWTSEDRRRRTESEALGLTFRKGQVKGSAAGATARGGKRKAVVNTKDKGKPKRFTR